MQICLRSSDNLICKVRLEYVLLVVVVYGPVDLNGLGILPRPHN